MAGPGVRIAEVATQIGVAVTALSGIAYACGYLSRAARARALGTEPDLVLISQAYVYGGFRFGLFTLLAFLVVLPLVVLLRAMAARISAALRPVMLAWLQSASVAVLALLTLIWCSITLRASDVLLLQPGSGALSPGLCEAVLGRNDLGLALIIGATTLGACSVLLLRARYAAKGFDTVSLALGIIAVVHLVLMPIQYGVFYADRTARQLERVPEAIAGAAAPVWLIDRGSEKVSLLARDAEGRLKLISIRSDRLDGIAVTRSVGLGEVVSTGGNSPCAPLPHSSG